jgi:L-ascorbate metabolism protein UlaG (beta-lactamase superfamily)
MSVTFRYLGWTAFELTLEDGRRIILDPMLAGRPEDGIAPSPHKPEEFDGADFVMVTHAAADHVGQAFEILQRSKAKLVCDVSTRFKALAAGIAPDRIFFMVSGVQFQFEGLLVKALPALHLSFTQLGENSFINSQPLSYVITSPRGLRIFFGGDTSISKDHQLFGLLYKPHIALLGVGGVNVLGQSLTELYPDEAARVARWLGVKVAIPMHYRFDEGTLFARELKRQAPKVKAVILKPGESYRFTVGRATPAVRRRLGAGRA